MFHLYSDEDYYALDASLLLECATIFKAAAIIATLAAVFIVAVLIP